MSTLGLFLREHSVTLPRCLMEHDAWLVLRARRPYLPLRCSIAREGTLESS